MRRLVAIAVLFGAAAFGTVAYAWSEAGHKIVASIAFRQLTPDEQAKIVAILKTHPRYHADFEAKSKSEAAEFEWLFQQAAIWPDMARSFSGDARREFNRPSWHFIDIPQFLTPADQKALEGKLRVNISYDPPQAELGEMNVIQTIRLARKALADKSTSDADKAKLLCWIFHDVGDIHQPLHSTALFSVKLFPAGDRGGNSIATVQRQNLHALWDQFPGNRIPYATARSKAIRALSDPDLSTIGKQAAADLDEQHWAQESFELSTSAVYNSEVTGHLRALAESGQSPQDVPLQLTEEYLKAGGAVSERRLVEAGFRLGAVLKQVAAGTQVKSSGTVASASPENPGTGGDSKEITVYIAKSGHSYHADGCRYLSKSKIPISLSEAKEKYTPCPICHPPE